MNSNTWNIITFIIAFTKTYGKTISEDTMSIFLTHDILHKFNKEYKVIIVGDASMSPYEIASQYGSVEHYNEESGETWMRRLTEQFDNVVWLNPIQEKEWKYTHSIGMMKTIVKDNMFPLTLQGIGKAIQSLLN